MNTTRLSFFRNNRLILIFFGIMLILPFIIGLAEGSSLSTVFTNKGSISKFVEGFLIEILILALFALSYDLLFGITGLLSFGHAMFYAVPAYFTGIVIKNFDLPFFVVLGLVVIVAILQALLFSLVLPRVKGITFALVTLGMASVFHIVVMSSDMNEYTGSDVGLQGVIGPAFLNPATERLRFYVLVLVLLVTIFIIYKRFVKSPTGSVCIAIRENENRAKMLGYNTASFKIVALLISSMTAAIAGTLHALYQPIINPGIADLGFTVTGLLVVLIGGVGTLSGALIGSFVIKILDFGLRRFIGEGASFILGAIYIAFVLFIPYGIVGTYQIKRLGCTNSWKHGWEKIIKIFSK